MRNIFTSLPAAIDEARFRATTSQRRWAVIQNCDQVYVRAFRAGDKPMYIASPDAALKPMKYITVCKRNNGKSSYAVRVNIDKVRQNVGKFDRLDVAMRVRDEFLVEHFPYLNHGVVNID